ncbi:MAG: type II toxin-antitoxin system HipA family toxin [bacterium]|nr:type II toxin-antitoxin system HipA family toxin [bacterium]
MKQCLACGENVYGNTQLHPPCAKKIFGVEYLPGLRLDPEDMPPIPPFPTGRFSLAKVQATLSLTFNRKERVLEKKGRKPGFLLKFPVNLVKDITRNQVLSVQIAHRLGVAIPRHTLMPMADGSTACLARTFDRVDGHKIRNKDFARILDKIDPYDGSLEEVGEKIKRVSEIPGLDVQHFFEVLLLSFIIGNSDVSFSKFYVFYDERRHVRFGPLQDIVSTKLFQPDEEDFLLPMNGKTSGITGEDFLQFSRSLKIPPKAYDKMFLRFFSGKRFVGRLINYSHLEMPDRIEFQDIVNDRFTRLMS